MFIHYLTCIKVGLSSIIKIQLSKLPSKRVIWLVIFLVGLTLVVFWYVGYTDNKKQTLKREAYLKEILAKEKNFQSIALKEVEGEKVELIPIPTIKPPIISTTTTSLNKKAQIREYGLAMTKALSPLSAPRDNEVKAILSAIEKNDPKLLSPVTNSRIIHEKAYGEITKIIVPKDENLKKLHYKVLYELSGLVGVFYNMEQAWAHPSQGLLGSKSLTSNYPNLLKAIDNLKIFYQREGVTFTEKEQTNIFWSLD